MFAGTSKSFAAVTVEQVSLYVSAAGVVFATVWASGNRWASKYLDHQGTLHSAPIMLATPDRASDLHTKISVRRRSVASDIFTDSDVHTDHPSREKLPLSLTSPSGFTREDNETVA
jgi:hypothetical protein